MKSARNDNLLEIIEEILPFFSQLYFFNKLHKERPFPVIKPQSVSGLNEEGKMLALDAQDFSLLWLIRTLAIESHVDIPQPYCEQTLVQQFYLWRRAPENENEATTANNRFAFLMKRLMATDLVDYEDHPNTRRKHVIFLTPNGERLLQDLRKERAQQLLKIFCLTKLKRSEQKRLVQEFETMATNAWEILHSEINAQESDK